MTAKELQRLTILTRWMGGTLSTEPAVRLLGTSERTAWRLRAALREEGVAGLVHGNRGRPSPRRLDPVTRARIEELARTTYRGYNDTHLAEVLLADEGIRIGRSSLQRLLRTAGRGAVRTRRPPRYRSRRTPMAQAGLLVQVDGSRHDWLEGRGLTLGVGAIRSARSPLAREGRRVALAVEIDARRPAALVPWNTLVPASLADVNSPRPPGTIQNGASPRWPGSRSRGGGGRRRCTRPRRGGRGDEQPPDARPAKAARTAASDRESHEGTSLLAERLPGKGMVVAPSWIDGALDAVRRHGAALADNDRKDRPVRPVEADVEDRGPSSSPLEYLST